MSHFAHLDIEMLDKLVISHLSYLNVSQQRVGSHLLKKSLIESLIFCAVNRVNSIRKMPVYLSSKMCVWVDL